MSEEGFFQNKCPLCLVPLNQVPPYDSGMCPRCEWRWWNKDLFEYEQRLLAAGWLPPYEGRRVLETRVFDGEIWDHKVSDGYYRIIIEPIELPSACRDCSEGWNEYPFCAFNPWGDKCKKSKPDIVGKEAKE